MKYNETEGLTDPEREFVRYLHQQRDNEVRGGDRWHYEDGYIKGFIVATLMSPYRPKELTSPVLGDKTRNFLATSLSWNASEPAPKLAEQAKEADDFDDILRRADAAVDTIGSPEVAKEARRLREAFKKDLSAARAALSKLGTGACQGCDTPGSAERYIDYEPIDVLNLFGVQEHVPVAYRVPLDAQILRTVAAFPEGLRAMAKRIVENPAEKLTEQECRQWARDLLADEDMKEPFLHRETDKEIGCTTSEESYYRDVLQEILPLSFHDDISAREETQSDYNRALAEAREVFKRLALPIDQYIG